MITFFGFIDSWAFENLNSVTIATFTSRSARGKNDARYGLGENVMCASAPESLNRRSVLRCCCVMLLCAFAATPAWADCPKLLMTSGAFIWRQTNAEQAAYWGQTVGAQGFLLNEVMNNWDSDVGTDPDSNLWKLVHKFQSDYSQYGVTDNFITVGLYTVHDWNSPWQNEAVAKNFGHAAALAKYAGFKGVDLDLEPYKPTWGGNWALAGTVEQEGEAIAKAMHDAYPDMTLVIEKDGLYRAFQQPQPLTALANPQATPPDSSKDYHGGYQLAVPFLRGLLSVNWSHVVIATEETYKDPNIVNAAQQTSKNYGAFLGDGAVWVNLSVAPGLWPLGHSSTDKSDRDSPAEFAQHLQAAFGVSKQYVWIYSYGSAWQTDGPYGSGPVTANFQQYTAAVHHAREACAAGNPVPQPVAPPGRHRVRPYDPPGQDGIGARALPSVTPLRPVDSQRRTGTLPGVQLLHAVDPSRY